MDTHEVASNTPRTPGPSGPPAHADGSELGDLVRSLRRLNIGAEDTATAVARLLGLQPDDGAARTGASDARADPLRSSRRDSLPDPDDATGHIGTDDDTALDGGAAGRPGDEPPRDAHPPYQLVLRRRGHAARRPAWLDDPSVDALAPPPADDPVLPLAPLFDPRRQRAMLLALCDRWVPGDELDTAALSALVVAGRPIHAVPRLPQRSLRHGVLLLLDHRDGMAPYRADQQALVTQAHALMPSERVRVRRFTGTPQRRGVADERVAEDLATLSRETPVLVLSDLSLGGPLLEPERATAQEWAAALALAQRRHLPLRVLVPYARERWPSALQHHPALLEWSRLTLLGDVRRVVAGGP